MKRIHIGNSALLLVGTIVASVSWADPPVSWGPPTGAKGCAVMLEHEQFDVNSSHEGTGTVARPHLELSVVTSIGHSLPRTTWADDRAGMRELQRAAVADRMRLVKLDEPYTAEDLEYAQSFCDQAIATAK